MGDICDIIKSGFKNKGGIKMKHLRKTKIVGTIGPASENKLEELFAAGLNVTRVNYSHGSWDEQSEKTENIIRLRKELDIPVFPNFSIAESDIYILYPNPPTSITIYPVIFISKVPFIYANIIFSFRFTLFCSS